MSGKGLLKTGEGNCHMFPASNSNLCIETQKSRDPICVGCLCPASKVKRKKQKSEIYRDK